jgi:leucyl-tRNA synthetase
VAEELWQRLGKKTELADCPWPAWDAEAIIDEEILVVVQVNGKLRSRLSVAANEDGEKIKQLAMADEKILAFTEGKEIRKVVYVPGKLVNIVAA